jgi:hypothetical protein
MRRAYAGLFALVGWFAVVGQYIVGHGHDLAATVDYFSYFTILSNILVALTLTVAAVAPSSGLGRALLAPPMAVATVVYITVTGATFYFILAKLYHLEGWTKHLDHLLHYVMPPAFVVFWLVFVPKGRLHLRNVAWMLAAPLVYAAYTLVHGPFSGFYPYPFVDVPQIGYVHVFANIGKFIVLFTLVGCVYVLIDRVIGHFTRTTPILPRT